MSLPDQPRPTAGSVLVVDDLEAIRYFLEEALRKHGFEVRGVATGQEAIDTTDDRVDAVLLDLDLPDMPGLEVLDAIQRLPHPPPVIVLTGSFDRDAPACLSRGAHDFMSKPPGSRSSSRASTPLCASSTSRTTCSGPTACSPTRR